mgnify:CR=1 FL=1|jgi:hypothetical protein
MSSLSKRKRSYSADIIPGQDVVPVTKDDDNDLPNGPARALWVGVAGTLNIRTLNGSDRDNFPALIGLNQIQVVRVRLGGTASNIWAIY